MVILITNWVGKGSLGMVTVFCHSDQAKVEPLVMLPTLVQWNSHQPVMVVMKIFTSLPYFPWRSFWPPLPGCSHPARGFLNHWISTCMAVPVLVAPVVSHSGHPALGERG